MSIFARFYEYGVLRMLAPVRHGRFSLVLFEKMDEKKISLRLWKWAIDRAKQLDDDNRIKNYVERVMSIYPDNLYGYLEAADRYVKNNDFESAREILRQAPNSKRVSAALAALKRMESKELQIGGLSDNQEILGKEILKDDQQIRNKLRRMPLSLAGYEAAAKSWAMKENPHRAIRIMANMPAAVPRTLGFYLFLATLYEKVRDQKSSLKILLSLQKKYTKERRILFRISDIYRSDNQTTLAHSYLRAGKICYPVYGAARLLSFEVDSGFFEDAKNTLEEIFNFGAEDAMKFVQMVNRVSAYFPEASEKLSSFRKNARGALLKKGKGNAGMVDMSVRQAIRARWLRDARSIVDAGYLRNIIIDAELVNWLERCEHYFTEMEELIEIANLNENSAELIGICEGEPMAVNENTARRLKVVEVFIPTAFFADPTEEKPSYKTVRSTLKIVYQNLLGRPDVLVVPRHQYNWRYCVRKLSARALSYHTNSPETDPSWIHVQEAALAGRCTFDKKGFAGFSSIATDFNEIDEATKEVSSEQLNACHADLYERYVQSNESKYEQASERVKMTGDYVFVALQIPTDVVASLADIPGARLLRMVSEYYKKTGIRVVAKRHPYCDSLTVQSELELLEAEGLIELSDNSVHDLIDGAQVVFTVNSGVGLEALIHLKPVIVSGACDYAYAVSGQVSSSEDLYSLLGQKLEINKERVLRFLYFYMNNKSIDANDEPSIQGFINEWLNKPLCQSVKYSN